MARQEPSESQYSDPSPRRAIGYVRVSVDHERKVSPEIQAEAIEKLCAAKGWKLVHMEVERGRSAGTGKKRPGLDHVREMIRCGEADVLAVWKLDRCSRSVHDFSVLLEELRYEDAGFVSCTSPQLAGIRIVDGVAITGSWPAILDVETHLAIVASSTIPSVAVDDRRVSDGCCRGSWSAGNVDGRCSPVGIIR